MKAKFTDTVLKKILLENLINLKFDFMTPIQEKSLPLILQGKDVIAQAKTGSGKTAAFGLGILNDLNLSISSIQAMILCPTRELAEQVAKELRRLARTLPNVKILTICGGASKKVQEKSLAAGAHIVVGTPGRVLHHLNTNSFELSYLKIFALDEADKMLDMGFNSDILEISEYLPKKRQSLLFSATFPDDIKVLSKRIQKNATEIKIDITHNKSNIKQLFYELEPSTDKNDLLYKVLNKYKPERLIVFCNTKKESNDIANFLINRKIFAKCINGDLEQNERIEVLTKFSNKSLSVLVATDVVARGLDIEDLPTVLNYSLPHSPEAYIHRIGRTGRAGKKGMVFSFFDQHEQDKLSEIEGLTLKPCKLEEVSELIGFDKYSLVPPMKTIYISGGKKDKLRPGDIVGALIGEAKLDSKDIGDISIHNVFSYVAIKNNRIEDAISGLSTGKIKKRKFKVGLA